MSVGDDGWLDGADEISGGGGADVLTGGAGGDTLKPARRYPPLPTVGRGARFFLDQIARAEGTGDQVAKANGYASGYDVPYGYRTPPGARKPLTQMTLDEIDQLQAGMRNTPLGRYQLNRGAIHDARIKYGLTGRELFSGDLQDQLGRFRMSYRNYDDPSLTPDQLHDRFAHEWASIATKKTGQSVDPRQRVGMSGAAFLQYIDQARRMDAQR